MKDHRSSIRFRKIFGSQLPLETETAVFILMNVLDFFMTYVLLRSGAMEVNPLARFFMEQWGFHGMLTFKLAVVLLVCIIAQVVATQRVFKGRWLLNLGSLIVGCVVTYSVILYVTEFL